MSVPNRAEAKRNGGLLVYFVVLVSLQVFLLVVAVEGVLAHDPGPARAAAALSVVVFASALVFRWFLRDD